MEAIYTSVNSFNVFGDKTAEFLVDRRVKMDCGLDGVKYAAVLSSSFSSPYTTVVIDESDLTASLTDVWYGVVTAGSAGSLPDHSHDGSEGSGGTISGTTSSGIDSEIFVDMEEPTGFVSYKVGSDIAYSGSEISISGTYSYYIKGTKYYKSGADSTTVSSPAEGSYYIYFDEDTLTYTDTFTSDLLSDYAYVAELYWDDTNNEIIHLGDERHGMIMDSATHINLHLGEGTRYVSGLGLVDMTVDGDGSSDTHAQFGTGSGTILDEDLRHDIPSVAVGSTIPVFYKDGSGGNWRKDTQTGFAFLNGASYPKYNLDTAGTWSQPEIPNGDYVLCHLFATNDIDNPIISVMGQDYYDGNTAARAGANEELNNLILSGLPFAEFVALGTVIIGALSTYTNSVNAIIVSTDDGSDYVDWRTSKVNSVGATITDHGSLSGLANDDHSQYLLADGTRQLSGDWDYGSNTITGTGDIYCNDIYTSSGTVYIGDLNLSTDGENLLVNGSVISADASTTTVTMASGTPPEGEPSHSGDIHINLLNSGLYQTINSGYFRIGVRHNNTGMTHTESNHWNGTLTAVSDGNGGSFSQQDVSSNLWYKIDFGLANETGVYKLVYQGLSGYPERMPDSFRVEASNNDSDWDIIYSGTGAESTTAQTFEFGFASVPYRYWRLYVVVNHTGGSEFTVLTRIEYYAGADSNSYEWQQQGSMGSTTFSDLTDTPDIYDDGKYLQSTALGTEWAVAPSASGTDDHSHIAYVPWDFGVGTISGTGDIYCNDIYTASGTVYIGELKLSTDGTNLLVNDALVEAAPGIFTDLTDTPADYIGTSGQFLVSTGSAIEFSESSSTDLYDGEGSPDSETGKLNDYYIDTTNNDLYKKDVAGYGSNLATGGTATAQTDSHEAPLVVDGNTGTQWKAAVTNQWQWWKYDLGAGNEIVLNKIRHISALSNNVEKIQIHGSNNDSDWDLLYEGNVTLATEWNEHYFNDNEDAYRYIRINVDPVGSGNPALSEAEFYSLASYSWGFVDNVGVTETDLATTSGTLQTQINNIDTGPTTFSGLSDTPADYGTSGYFLQSTGSGTDWATVETNSGGSTTFSGLSDTPVDYGLAGQIAASTGSGIEWSNNNINSVNTDYEALELVREFNLNDETLDVTISGIQGDTNTEWVIVYHLADGTESGGAFHVNLNNDTASNYYRSYIGLNNGSVVSQLPTNYSYIDIAGIADGSFVAGRAEMFLKSGVQRIVQSFDNRINTSTYTNVYFTNAWTNTVDEVDSMMFDIPFKSSGYVKLYKRANVSLPITPTGVELDMAKMTRDAAQSIPNASNTLVEFDTVEYDIGNITDVSNNKFVINQVGKYLINASCDLSDSGQAATYVKVNGEFVSGARGESNIWQNNHVIDTFDLQAGDYIELFVYQVTGDAHNTSTLDYAKPKMSVTRLAEYSGGESGVTTLSGLSDTPADYGTSGYFLQSTGSGTNWAAAATSGTDDHPHAAYVPWDFGAGTISGTGDIYCNDIHTASGTVYIGDLKLSTDGQNLLVDDQPIEATGAGGSTTFSGLSDTPNVYPETVASISITIDHTKIDTPLTDFPLTVVITNPAVFAEIGENSKKIQILTESQQQCYTEVELWNGAGNKAVLHTKVPSISAVEDTVLNIVYSSDLPDNTTYIGDVGSTPAQLVWDSDFIAVYNMAQSPAGGSLCIKDSTSNNTHGTPAGGMGSGDLVDGLVGKGIDFDGGDDEINVPYKSSMNVTTQLTVEILHKPDDWSIDGFQKLVFRGAANPAFDWFIQTGSGATGSTDTILGGTYNPISTSHSINLSNVYVPEDVYYYTALTQNSGAMKGFHDGAHTNNATGETNFENNTHTIVIGGEYGNSANGFDGVIDNIRVSKIARSEAWIKATNFSLRNDLCSYESLEIPFNGYLGVNGSATGLEFKQFPSFVENLLDLDDTPTTYSGTSGYFLQSTGSGTNWAEAVTSGTDDHSHAAYVPWNFGGGTISGTGDIYCNDIHTASGTVYIGDLKLSTDGQNLLVNNSPIEASPGALTTFSGLSDTPVDYGIAGQIAASTGSGIEWSNNNINSVNTDYVANELVREWNLTSSGIDETFTGWDGDVDDVIYFEIVNAEIPSGSNVKIRFNNDTGTNYEQGYMTQNSTTHISDSTTGSTSALLSNSNDNVDTNKTIWHLKTTGQKRVGITEMATQRTDVSTQWWTGARGCFWNNTADKITSFRIFSDNTDLTGTFRLFKRTNIQLPVGGGTTSGTLLQDGSTPLTADWNFGAGTISGTGDIYCNDIYTSAGTAHIGDVDLSAPIGNFKLKTNTIGGTVSIEGTGNVTIIPEFISAASNAIDGPTSSFVCDKPAGTEEDDLLLCTFSIETSGNPTVTAPAGWTYLLSEFNAVEIFWHYIYYKFAGPSEPADYTWSYSGSVSEVSGGIISVRNVDKTTPIGDYGSSQGFSTSITAPTIELTSDNELVVHTLSFAYGSSITPPSGYVEAYEAKVNTASTRKTTQASYKTYPSPGSTGPQTATTTSSSRWIATHLAIKPFQNGEPRSVIKGDPDGRTQIYDGGNLALETTATSGINITNEVTAVTYYGDGSNLTGIDTSGGGSTTFSGLSDTPVDYGNQGDYLQSTGSGMDWTSLSPAPAEGNWVLVSTIEANNETISGSIPWDGDTWPRARIESAWTQCTAVGDTNLRLNNDSGSNYTLGYMTQDGSVVAASSDSYTHARYCLGSVHTTRQAFATTNLYLKSGGKRFFSCIDTIYDSANTDRVASHFAARWENTVDNVTSIDISTAGAVSCTIKVYRWRDITDIPVIKGKQSLQVEYATTSGIYINPGEIHMANSTFGMYELDDRTEVTVSGLAVDTWYYVYVDVSSATATLDLADFTVSSGIPTIDYPNRGYYNGNDRCIGAFYVNSTPSVIEFWHSRGKIKYQNYYNDYNGTQFDDGNWHSVTHRVPDWVGGLVSLNVNIENNSTDHWFRVRTYGSSAAGRRIAIQSDAAYTWQGGEIEMPYGNQKTEFKYEGTSTGADARIETLGFALPDYIYTGA